MPQTPEILSEPSFLGLQWALYDDAGANAAFTVYVWGMQVEQRSGAGGYVKTTAAAVDTGPPRSDAARAAA